MYTEHSNPIRGTNRGVARAHIQRFATLRGGFYVPECRGRDVNRERAQTREVCVFDPPINGSEIHGRPVDDSEAFILNIEANDGTERHIPIAAGD